MAIQDSYYSNKFKFQFESMYNRVSQIAGVFQKMIFESCILYQIMPFAKIIGRVQKKFTKS